MHLTPWAELSSDSKTLLLTDLLLTLQGRANDPVLCMLVPTGTEEEVKALWKYIVDKTITSPHNEAMYYETIDHNTTRPSLFFASDQELALLTRYLNVKIKESGIDLTSMISITPTLDSLRAFYLASEILPLLNSPCKTTSTPTSAYDNDK